MKSSKSRQFEEGFALRPIAFGVMLACAGGAWANPTGPRVAAGAATFQTKGGTLNVTNTPGTIINWQSFSIGGNELTRFIQRSPSSAVLNRVVGSDGSSILGSLTSNGRVFLINPHGIVFGAGARIDTAGFIASTLNMTDRDFLRGVHKFEGGGNGVLRNEGTIRARGDIMLVGPIVENAGLIRSDGGAVLLAAGKSVTITSPDVQGVKFELQAPDDRALNLGRIDAYNSAAMFAGTLVHSGDIRAVGADVQGTRVVLSAQKDASVAAGAVIDAGGKRGGSVLVQSGDVAKVAGRIDASGSEGPGGTVHVLGERVLVDAGAAIDASGRTGGGTILVGGDFQGGNAAIRNASQTIVERGASLNADATGNGDGGKVIVWADDITRHHGNISARGGSEGGDGGFVEVSGKKFLEFAGTVDTRAPHGRTGTLLLDPTTVNIVAGDGPAPNTGMVGASRFQDVADAPAVSEITVGALQTALVSNDVVISTESTGTGAGDINLNTQLDFNGVGASRKLTLLADRNINLANPIVDSVAGGDTLNLMLVTRATASATNISHNIDLAGGVIDASRDGTGVVNIAQASAPSLRIASPIRAQTVNVNAGPTTVELASTVSAPSINLQSGTLDVQSTTGALPSLTMSGGVLTRSVAGDVVIDGAFAVSGGVIGAGPTANDFLRTEGATSVTGPIVVARDWINNGTVDLSASVGLLASIGLPNGATFRNQGTLNLVSVNSLLFIGGTVTNAAGATINKTSAGPNDIFSAFENAAGATVNINSGDLIFPVAVTQQGRIEIASGASLSTGGFDLVNGSTGLIGGNGIINVGLGTLVNQGTLRPGAPSGDGSIGTLTVLGNVRLMNGSNLDMEIRGPADNDRLTATGAATLGGNLNLTLPTGFEPEQFSSAELLTYGLRIGSSGFTINSPAGYIFTPPASAPTSYSVTASSVPITVTWDGGGNDLSWNNANNWDTGFVPNELNNVVIPDLGNAGADQTIVIPTLNSVRKLTSSENLTITGGELVIGAGNSSVTNAVGNNATISVSGAAIAANGALDVNVLNLTGSSVVGAGRVTAGTLSMTNGTIATPTTVVVNGMTTVGASALPSMIQGTLATNGLTVNDTAALNVQSGGRLDLRPGLSKSIGESGAAVRVEGGGVLTLTGAQPFMVGLAGALQNDAGGRIEVTGGANITGTALGSSFTNNGTLVKSGAGELLIDGADFNFANSGRLDAQAGTIRYAAGSNTFNNGTRFAGPGSHIVAGDSAFSGSITSSGLNLSAGLFSGDATFDGTTTWTGGTIQGAFTFAEGSTLNVTGSGVRRVEGATEPLATSGTVNVSDSSDLTLTGVTWDNFGVVNLTGSGLVTVENGATLRNRSGGFIHSATDAFSAIAGAGSVLNEGTFNKSSASAAFQNIGPAFDNAGIVNVRSGTLALQQGGVDTGTYAVNNGASLEVSGGTRTFEAGITLPVVGSGTLGLSGGTLDVKGGVLPSLEMSGGMLTRTTDGDLTIQGSFDVSDGAIGPAPGGGGNLVTLGRTRITGVVNPLRSWVNQGVLSIDPGPEIGMNGVISPSPGLEFRFTNVGTVDINTLADKPFGDVPPTDAAILNFGTFNKNAGSAPISDIAYPFTNDASGTINVNAGTLRLTGMPTQAGRIRVATGTTLATGGNLTNEVTGEISGSGTIDLAGGALTNEGTLKPGTSPGTLNVTGDLVLAAAGNVQIEVQAPGVTPGTDYDVINVTGEVRGAAGAPNDWGTLTVTHSDVGPPAGTFSILSYGSRQGTGDFTTRIFPRAYDYTATPGATGYALTNLAAVNTWTGLAGDGLWQTSGNWSLLHVPTAAENALIPDVGVPGVSNTITISAAGQLARKVIGDENLAIASGQLTLGNVASSIGTGTGATLIVSGGTLTADGTLNTSAVNLSGGTINGSGALNIDGALTWTGGTIAGAGLLTTNAATTLSGAAGKTLDTRTWNVAGNVTQTGDLSLAGNAIINNQATRTWSIDTAADADPLTGAGTFNNQGTLNKNGNQSNNLSLSSFNNTATGTVNVNAGRLVLNAASAPDTGVYAVDGGATLQFNAARTLAAGATVSGAGEVRFTSGLVDISGAYGVGTTTIDGGDASFNSGATTAGGSLSIGTLGGSGTLTVVDGGAFDWTGGNLSGAGTLAIFAGSGLNVSGNASREILNGYGINNAGTVTWTGAGNVSADQAVVITNSGQWNAQNDSALTTTGAGTITFNNTGTLTKSGAGTTSAFTGAVAFNNGGSGTVNVNSGTLNLAGGTSTGTFNVAGGTLQFGGGSHAFGAGTTLTGTGRLLLSGGALNVNSDLTQGAGTPTWEMTGGTLGGTGNLTLNSDFNASAGTITGSGRLTTGGTTNITGPVTLTEKLWDNAGNLTMSGDSRLTLDGSGAVPTAFTNLAGGVVTSTSSNPVLISSATTSTSKSFVNAGTFNKDAGSAAAQEIQVTANNSGTVNVNNGTLRLTGSGTDIGGYNVGAGTTLEFGGGTRTLAVGSNVTGAGTVAITAGLLTVSGDYAPGTTTISGPATAMSFNAGTHETGTLNLTDGTLGGTGNLTVTGGGTWSGGQLVDTVRLTVGPDATFNLTNQGGNVIDGATLANAGTLNLATDGNLVLNNGATLDNSGTLDIQTAANIVRTSAAGATPTLINSGTITKSGGDGNSTIGGGAPFNFTSDGGTFDVAAGNTLTFAGANTFNDGTRFIGAGMNVVTSDSTFNGTITSNGLTLQSGNFGGTATLAGQTDWTGGNVTGAFTVAPNGTLNVAGGGATTISPAASLTVNGTMNVAADQTIGAAFTNAGTVNVDGGTLRLTFGGTDTGAYAVDPGATLELAGGTRNLNGAVTGAGALLVSGGIANVNAGYTAGATTIAGGNANFNNASSHQTGALTLSGGTLGGTGDLTVANGGTWTGGRIEGTQASLTIASGAIFNITGGLEKTVDAATVTNAGDVNLSGAGNLVLNNGAVLDNSGSFNILSNAGILNTVGTAMIANTGTLRKAGGAGISEIGGTFNNTGDVEVVAGSLRFTGGGTDTGTYSVSAGTTLDFGGGTRDLNAGASLNSLGTVAVSGGTLNVNADYAVPATTISGGTANFNADVRDTSTLTLSGGTLGGRGLNVTTGGTWSGGRVAGADATLSIAPGALFDLSGDAVKTVDGAATLANRGTLNLSGEGSLVLNNGAALANGGLFDIRTDAGVRNSAGAGTFANAGVLRKSAGAGESVLGSNGDFAFSNAPAATIDVQSGTLRSSGAFATNDGTINVEAGATFSTTGAALTNAGLVRGAGTIDLGSETFTNIGIVAPGNPTSDNTGRLTITGNLAQGLAGRVEIELGGTGQGQFDSLSVSGNAALDGTVALTTTGGYTPAIGDTFNIVSSGTRSGFFDTTTKTFANEVIPTYGGSGLSLLLGSTTGNTWIFDVSGDWTTGRLWSQGRTPIATDQVVIDRPAGEFTVTIPAGDFSADTLRSTENVTLTGTLGLAGASSVTGTLAVNGGTLQGAGPVAVTGTLALDGATLAGTGGVTVTGSTNIAGAPSRLTGPLTVEGLSMTGGLAVDAGGTLNLSGAGAKTITGATLTNNDTVNLSGTGNLVLNNGATLDNRVLFDIQSDADVLNTAGAGTFTNTGELRKSAGAGTSVLGSNGDFVLSNAAGATIDVRSGTLRSGGAFPTNAGTINLESGATFSTTGAALTNAATGIVSGAGTLNVGDATFTNNGIIAPGTATDNTGRLTIAGNLAQGLTGRTQIELGGTGQGQFDSLSVSGNAVLDGTLALTTTGGYAPAIGDTFNIVTSGTRSGFFDTTTKTFGNEVIPTYAGSGLTLLLGSTTGNTWIFDVSGEWTNPKRWSQGRAPIATDQVVIDRPAGELTVTIPVGDFSADTLRSTENVTLTGTLGLAGASSVTGTLAVNGGTLQGAGPVAVTGTLALDGATLAGTGGVTVSGSTNVAGAASRLTGPLTVEGLSMTGGLTVDVDGVLNLAAAGTKTITGATLTNSGTVNQSGDLTLNGGGVLDNVGAFDIQTNAGIGNTSGTGTFTNTGTLTKSGGSESIVAATFNNAGSVSVGASALRFTGSGTDTGAYSVTAGTALDFGGGTRDVNAGASITGPGALIVSGGTANLNNTPQVGAIAVSGGTANFNANVAGVGAFTVTGGISNANAGYTAVTTTISGGTANFNGAGAHATNTLTFTGGTLGGTGNLDVSAVGTWSGGRVAGADATLSIGAGAVLNLTEDATKTVDGATLVNRGTLNLSGEGNLVLNNGATLANSGTFDIQTNADIRNTSGAGTFANTGELRKSGGTDVSVLGSNGDFVLSNAAGATIDVQSGTLRSGGAFPTNAGTINLESGATFSTTGAALTNAGLVRGAGTIDLGGETFTNVGIVAPGTATDNTGLLTITGNFAQGLAGRTEIELGGTGQGQFDSLSVSGNAALDGTLALTTTGGYTPAIGDTFNIVTSGTRSGFFDTTTKTFANEVIPTYGGSGLSLLLGSTTGNTWIFDVSGDWTTGRLWSQGRAPIATDQVVIDRPAGELTVTIPVGDFSADTLRSTENVTLTGTLGLAGASSVTGTLAVNGGTLQGTGPVTVTGTLALAGGTLAGPGGVTVIGSTDASGATGSRVANTLTTDGLSMTGGLTVDVDGVLNLAAAGTKTITGATLTNSGTVNQSGDLTLNGGAVFDNRGTFNIQTNAGIGNTSGTGTFTNTSTGTLTKSGGSESVIAATFNNAGSVSVDASALRLTGSGTDTGAYSVTAGTALDFGGGTRDVNAGASITGPGALIVSGGTANLNISPAVATIAVSGGTANFNANVADVGAFAVTGGISNVNAGYTAVTTTVSGGTANFNGAGAHATDTLTLTGGTLGGTGNLDVSAAGTWSGGRVAGTDATLSIGAGAVLNLTEDATKTVDGATVVNLGTVNLAGAGNLALNNGGVFDNRRTFDIQSDADVLNTAGAGTFTNTGELRKSAGAGTSVLGSNGDFVLSNAAGATIDVRSGTLRSGGAFPTNAGTINLESGATFSTTGAALTNAATGIVSGAGTLNVGDATFTNNGIIAPGTATDNTGRLTIAGNLAQGLAGRVEIELGGTAAGQFDSLSVSGNAALDGTLALTTTGGYAPAIGDTFNIVTSGTRSGFFDATTKTFANEVIPTYAGSGLTLLLGSTTGNTWIFDASGEWTNPKRWSQGRAPIATDQVVIDRPAGEFTVTIPAGDFSADTLRSTENVTLTGTLGLAGASSVTGTLAVNGGTLQGAGPVTVTGTLALAGGTLAGPGGVTVIGSTDASGATGSRVANTLTSDGLSMTGGLTVDVDGVLNLAAAGTKTITGATLTNSGTVNLAGDLTLNGGGVLDNAGAFDIQTNAGIGNTSGTGTFTNTSTGTLTKSGGSESVIATTFNNAGSVSVDASALRFTGSGTDTGAYSVAAGTALDFGGGTRDVNAGASITGPGALIVSGGTANLNNTPQVGSIAVSGGTANFNANVAGVGAFTVTGGISNANAGYTAVTTTVSGGTANFNADVGETATLNLTGGTLGGRGLNVATGGTWSGGRVAGADATLTIADGAVLNLTEDATKTVDGATVVNRGRVNLAGAGDLALNNGGVFDNRRTFDIQTDADIRNTSGAGTFANTGELRKSGGTDVSVLGSNGDFAFSNAPAATIDVQSGTLRSSGAFATNAGTINVEAGTRFSTTGAALTNAGLVRGAGTIDLGGETLTNLGTVAPGTATDNTGRLTIAGNFAQGLAGRTQIELGGTGQDQFDRLSVSGNAALDGTLALTTTGGYAPAIGDTFNIVTSGTRSGFFDATTKTFANEVIPTYAGAGLSLFLGSTTGNTWIFDVSGDWTTGRLWSQGRAPLATDNVVIDRPVDLFTVTIPAGQFSANTLRSTENVTLTGALGLAGASSVTGTLAVNGGTLQGAGPVTVTGTLALAGGTLAGPGGVTVIGSTDASGATGSRVANTSLTTNGLSVTGDGLTVEAGATMNLTGAGVKTIAGGTLTNAGTMNLVGTSDVTLSGGALLENFGAMNLGGATRVVLGGDGGATLVNRGGATLTDTTTSTSPITAGPGAAIDKLFVNAGTFTKAGGSAGVQTIGVPMTNTGTIEVLAGTLGASAFPVNSGVLDLRAGTTFSTTGNALTNAATGLLKGNGTLNVGDATFTNNGLVAPGASAGTLTIEGNFAQGPGGTLATELGGTLRGTDFDLFRVTGNAALGGTLAVTTTAGEILVPDFAYDFMTYASRTGDFAFFAIPPGSTFVAGPTGYQFFAPVVVTPSALTQITAEAQKDSIIFYDRTSDLIEGQTTTSDDEKKNEQECR